LLRKWQSRNLRKNYPWGVRPHTKTHTN
jgi:hypothetical protein